MNPMIGQIEIFGGNFAPRGWAICAGQLLPINQYTALFSILGTTYGGDGRTTFALPDLRGREAVSAGNGPGLSPIVLGQKGGAEVHYLNSLEMANHGHDAGQLKGTLGVNEEDGTSEDPQGKTIGVATTGMHFNTDAPDKSMTGNTVSMSGATSINGASQPFSIRNPYQAVNYIIALQGIYPSRS
ncbi:phage tail protein [uncultured Psychroserpens sp.]|uniref:phage tail protein n=1 Tax=uncultured Psychroserpens sp. TaxID=255436 RepID=UPI002606E4DF|nr:tail fiber protein [uncultured Psychroserpens sp.]